MANFRRRQIGGRRGRSRYLLIAVAAFVGVNLFLLLRGSGGAPSQTNGGAGEGGHRRVRGLFWIQLPALQVGNCMHEVHQGSAAPLLLPGAGTARTRRGGNPPARRCRQWRTVCSRQASPSRECLAAQLPACLQV